MSVISFIRNLFSKQKRLKWYTVVYGRNEWFLQAYGVGDAKYQAWKSFRRKKKRTARMFDEFCRVARARKA